MPQTTSEKLERVTEEYEDEFQLHLARYRFAQQFMLCRRILDIACGTGYGSHLIADKTRMVTAVDISWEAVSFATQHYATAGASFVQGNGMSLPFSAGAFDAVVSFETVEHLHDDKGFVRELARVLCPGGVLLLSTPNRAQTYFANPFHVREYCLDEINGLLQLHFSVETIYGQIARPAPTAIGKMGLPLEDIDHAMRKYFPMYLPLKRRLEKRIPELTRAHKRVQLDEIDFSLLSP